MKPIEALFSALAISACLSACVGTDPNAAMPAGGVALTAFSTPVPLVPERGSKAMPGDLLSDPDKAGHGVDPLAVLMRPATHATAFSARSAQTVAARLEEPPKRPSGGMTTLSAGPMPATRTASADDAMPVAAPKPALTSFRDVEAQAAIEQRAQNVRDRRFDTQVRHASNIVCSGCLAVSGRGRRAAPVAEQDD